MLSLLVAVIASQVLSHWPHAFKRTDVLADVACLLTVQPKLRVDYRYSQ